MSPLPPAAHSFEDVEFLIWDGFEEVLIYFPGENEPHWVKLAVIRSCTNNTITFMDPEA